MVPDLVCLLAYPTVCLAVCSIGRRVGCLVAGSENVEVFVAKVDLINCSHVCTVHN